VPAAVQRTVPLGAMAVAAAAAKRSAWLEFALD